MGSDGRAYPRRAPCSSRRLGEIEGRRVLIIGRNQIDFLSIGEGDR